MVKVSNIRDCPICGRHDAYSLGRKCNECGRTDPRPGKMKPIVQKPQNPPLPTKAANRILWSIRTAQSDFSAFGRIQQIIDGPEGQRIKSFLQQNFDAPQPHAALVLQQYKSNPDIWGAFTEIASEFPGGASAFEQKVLSPQQPATPQPTVPVQPSIPAPVENAEPDSEMEDEFNTSDDYADEFMDQVEQVFMSSSDNIEWLSEIQKTQPNIAHVIYDAPHNFFTGKSRRKAKKWKELFLANPKFLPTKLQLWMQKNPGTTTKEAIEKDLRSAAHNNRKPLIIERLEELSGGSGGRADQKILDAIIGSARSLQMNHGQSGKSLDFNTGEDGRSAVVNLTADPKAAKPSDIVGTISDSELAIINPIASVFMNSPENEDFFTKMSQMKSEDGKSVLDSFGNEAQQILSDAVSYGLTDTKGENAVANWKEFFYKNPHYMPQDMRGLPLDKKLEDMMSQRVSEMAPILQEVAEHGMDELHRFLIPLASEYLMKVYDEKRINRKGGDLNALGRNIGRVAKLTNAFLKRELEWNKVNYPEAVPNATRRVANYFCKTNVALQQLKDLLSGAATGQTAIKHGPGGNQVIRNDTGRLVIQDPTSGARELTEDSFAKMFSLLKPEAWVPKSINMMKDMDHRSVAKTFGGVDKASGKGSINNGFAIGEKPTRGTKGRITFPCTPTTDEMTDQHIQQNGWKGDHLAGWRKALGHHFMQAVQKSGKTVDDIANSIKGRKTGGIGGDPKSFIQNIINGKPQIYKEKDMDILGRAMGFQPKFLTQDPKNKEGDAVHYTDFFSPAKYYDPYSGDDHISMNEFMGDAFRSYAGFLVHKKREEIKSGRKNGFFDPNTMYYFLSIVRPHAMFSKGGDVGRMLYQLTNRPIGVDENKITMDEIRENLRVNDKGVPYAADEPNIYKNMPAQSKQYSPNSTKPTGISRKHFQPKDIALTKIPDPVLQHWQEKRLSILKSKLTSPTTDATERSNIQKRLQHLMEKLPTMSKSEKVKAFMPKSVIQHYVTHNAPKSKGGPGGTDFEPRYVQRGDQMVHEESFQLFSGFFKTMSTLDNLGHVYYANSKNNVDNTYVRSLIDNEVSKFIK